MRICARALSLGLIACAPAPAHAISMSSGYATVSGNRVEYILRMPSYEVAALRNPEQALLDHIRFSSGFESGRRTDSECHSDSATSTYVCAANYTFSRPVERLSVECTFYDVTAANHIHVLRAENGGKVDRAILDSSFSYATMAFRPPTAFENALRQSLSGARRVLTNAFQLLMLSALTIAARQRRELIVLSFVFIAAEWTAALLMLHSTWQPEMRFAESVAALALAYLAFEMTVFPKSGGRWVLVLIHGCFAGLYFSAFLSDSRYPVPFVLGGAGIVSVALIVFLNLAVSSLDRFNLRRAIAAALLAAGCLWFLTAAQLLPSQLRLNW